MCSVFLQNSICDSLQVMYTETEVVMYAGVFLCFINTCACSLVIIVRRFSGCISQIAVFLLRLVLLRENFN